MPRIAIARFIARFMIALCVSAFTVVPAVLAQTADRNSVEKGLEATGKGAKTVGVESGKAIVKGVKLAAKGGESIGDATVNGAEDFGKASAHGAEAVGKTTVRGAKKVGSVFSGGTKAQD